MNDNVALAALCQSYPEISRKLKAVDYVHGDVLAIAGAPIEHVIFPVSGLLSVVVDLAAGDRVGVAMIGRDGAVGGCVALGATRHMRSCSAQLPGRAWLMKSDDLIKIANSDAAMRHKLCVGEHFILAQSQQTAACNARHSMMQRICTFLLRASDAAGTGQLFLTQENLAQTLGVQRASVSVFASQLQNEGAIHYRRGRVEIKNRAALMRRACQCHSALRQTYDSMLCEGFATSSRTATA